MRDPQDRPVRADVHDHLQQALGNAQAIEDPSTRQAVQALAAAVQALTAAVDPG